MKTIFHLACTDLRRLWPLLLLLTAIHAFRAFSAEWASVWSTDLRNAWAVDGVNGGLLIAEVLVFSLAVSLVVHGDPLVGSRAFWLTRPIASRTMFMAKLLVLIVLLVLIPVMLNAGRLATYGAPASAVTAASAQLALSRLTWVALAWLVAAVTASTMAFFLVFAGAIAAAMAYLAIYASLFMQLAQRQSNRFYLPPLPLPDDTPTYLASFVLVGLGLAVIRLQYGVRRWKVSAPLSLVVLVLAGVALGSRSTVVAKATPPDPPSWLTDPATTSIRLAGDRLHTGSRSNSPLEREPTIHVDAWLQATGIEPGYSIVVLPHAARLVSSPEEAIDCWIKSVLPDASPFDRLDAFALATGLTELELPGGRRPGLTASRVRTTVCSAPASTIRRVAGKPARLEATLELRLTRHRLRAVLPLKPGAAVRTHPDELFEIVRIAPEGADWHIFVRHARFPSFRPRAFPVITQAIRDPSKRMVVPEPHVHRTGALLPLGFTFALRSDWGPFGTPWGSEWQSINELKVTAPEGTHRTTGLRDSELVLLESAYAGHVTHPWVVDAVYVEPLPDDM
jgi:hypothetical protein